MQARESNRPATAQQPAKLSPTRSSMPARASGGPARDPSGARQGPGAIEYASWLHLLRRSSP